MFSLSIIGVKRLELGNTFSIWGAATMSGLLETTFDRDKMALSYAKKHLDIDPGVLEIHHLSHGASVREIRFLEVNSLISASSNLEPIDFGVDTDSPTAHTLLVLDVTPDQWKAIIQRKLALPYGWSLEKGRLLGKKRDTPFHEAPTKALVDSDPTLFHLP